jgi:hypothetical protein
MVIIRQQQTKKKLNWRLAWAVLLSVTLVVSFSLFDSSSNLTLDDGPILLDIAAKTATTNQKKTTVETTAQETFSNNTGRSTTVDQVVRRNNRTLVILLGNLRCGETAWKTLYENVLDVNSADLALLVGETKEDYRNASLFARAKYIWNFPEYDDWADALDLINGSQWRHTVLPQISQYSLDKGLLGGVNGTPSSGAIQGMIKWWLAQRMIRNEDALLDKYDTFAITRTDEYYSCPLSFSHFNNSHIMYIPNGESYSGYCDRFYVTSNKLILESLDILPPFLNAYNHTLYKGLHNPEGLLKATLKRKNVTVRRFPRVMWTCNVAEDHTRWRLPEGDYAEVIPGIRLKYKNEYKMIQRNCRKMKKTTTKH